MLILLRVVQIIFEIVEVLEATLNTYEECSSHNANSLEEAYYKLNICNNDFMFFPMNSINSNLTNVVNLFNGIKVDSFRSQTFSLTRGDTYYDKEYLFAEGPLVKYFNENIASFIIDTILDSHLSLNNFIESTNRISSNSCRLQIIPENYRTESMQWQWHFDPTGAEYNLLLPFTSPGTEFCSTTYDKQTYSKLDEYIKNELFDKCNESNYQLQPGEAVIYKPDKGFHKAPNFKDGRALIRFNA